jgi:hypothetical protein
MMQASNNRRNFMRIKRPWREILFLGSMLFYTTGMSSAPRSKECGTLKTAVEFEHAAVQKVKREQGEGPHYLARLEQASKAISAVAVTDKKLEGIRDRIVRADRDLATAIREGQKTAEQTFDQKPLEAANAARDAAVKARGAAVEDLYAACP